MQKSRNYATYMTQVTVPKETIIYERIDLNWNDKSDVYRLYEEEESLDMGGISI